MKPYHADSWDWPGVDAATIGTVALLPVSAECLYSCSAAVLSHHTTLYYTVCRVPHHENPHPGF